MRIAINDISFLPEAARLFRAAIANHKVIAFEGEMGAGKTTFIKALCKELGVVDVASSPTFSLVNEYRDEANNALYHFDFYRINKESEALDMGCEEYFYSGKYCFIEWPKKVISLLPTDCLFVKITVEGSTRIIQFSNL